MDLCGAQLEDILSEMIPNRGMDGHSIVNDQENRDVSPSLDKSRSNENLGFSISDFYS